MASNYLHELIKKVKLEKETKKMLKHLTYEKARQVYETIDIDFFSKRSKLRPVIEEFTAELNSANVEENIRKAKIMEIRRQKKLLEAKLNQIDNYMQQVDFPEESKYIKPNLQIEKFRREYFEEEKRKSDENAKKTREYYLEQKRRQQKIQKHIEELMHQEQLEKHEKVQKSHEKQERFSETYQQELEKMQENTRKRKQELEEAKNRELELADVIKKKPLYQKIQEKYTEDVEFKELEKRKMELAKKRMMFQPISRQEIIEHIKWHDSSLKEREKSPNLSIISERPFPKSRFLEEITKKEKELKLEEERQMKEKMKRLENKKVYADTIRELYTPTIDKFKQTELLLRLEKLKNPVVKKKFHYENSTAAQSDGEIKRSNNNKKKIIESIERNKSKPIDYLAERRKKRENYEVTSNFRENDWEEVLDEDLPSDRKYEIIQKKAKKLDEKAKKAELLINSTNLAQPKNLENSKKADSMLISSIKAKLEVLKHV
ncbi:hypothetical protein SteCoe_28152 [Stentor coeruleus]|uniref:Uncharacterized protein n=1 Tax=Stentor coeruleus TaxID=5963 RepID=A0A1R2B8Y2_9CILI|nr:hypothetical protein SteCoe_28152 [Stentor coeruleus]